MMRIKILIYTIILSAVIVATPAYAGTGMFDRGSSERESRRRGKSITLPKVEQAFVEGDYEKVIIIGTGYTSRRTKRDDELQYLMGRALLKLERFEEARNRFSRVINDSDSDKLLDESYLGLADSYYLEGDYKKAKEHYEKVMRYFPDLNDMPTVYCRLGECHSKLGDDAASKEYYDKLVRLYPYSLETILLGGEESRFLEYSIQVGSFEKWGNAKKLCDELKGKEFDADIYTTVLGGSHFYRVRVGRFNRLGDAEDMARTLRNRGYPVKIYP
jgi:tetratricopeptide (TPR) repeat protein